MIAICSIPEKSIPLYKQRVPQQQLLIEMAELLRQQMPKYIQPHLHTAIKPCPKYKAPNKIFGCDCLPHSEILLYEKIDREDQHIHDQ